MQQNGRAKDRHRHWNIDPFFQFLALEIVPGIDSEFLKNQPGEEMALVHSWAGSVRREGHGVEIRSVCSALMAGCQSFLLAALLDHCSQAVFLFPPRSCSRHICGSTGMGPDCAPSGLSQPGEALAQLSPSPSLRMLCASWPWRPWQEMGFCAETICYQISPGLLACSVYSSSINFKERLFLGVSFDLEVSVKPTIFNPYGMHCGMSWPDVGFPAVPTQNGSFICY